ncbi:MAG: hypothetical protein CVU98_00370 [Firmicutes bacterium HGW-Firmicutes-3]|nr:MAG: hypothetical protein CVU98_00370 [Firmicutes bacterium HGW-Firmicutes-3]
MKILIVEDEFYMRKALIKIIHGKYNNDCEITEAENGIKATEYFKDNYFDIVITDIRMPQMNGLELAEWIQKHYPHTFIIIISGYSEFEYAQKALKYKVKEYILKPLEKEEIYRVLDTVFKEVDVKVLKEKQEAILIKNATQAIERQELASIINNRQNLNKEDFMELLDIESEQIFFSIMVVRYKKVINEQVKESFKMIFRNANNIKTYYNYANRNEMLVFSYGYNSLKHYVDEIYSRHLYCIKNMISMGEADDVVIGISKTHDRIIDFSVAYDEARQSLLNYFLLGWGKVYIYSDNMNSDNEPMKMSNDLFNRFKSGLMDGDLIRSTNTLNRIVEFLVNYKNNESTESTAITIQLFYMKLEIILDEVANKNNIKLDTRKEYDSFNEVGDLVDYFSRLISIICKEMDLKNKETSVIKSLVEYIKNNYYEPLSLDEIASKMYFMNPSYLSRLFHDETGDTFSKTLLNIRMEKAKQLLDEQELSITEVAVTVGYNNVAYFIKTFKSIYQQTPGQYRKTCGNKSNMRN